MYVHFVVHFHHDFRIIAINIIILSILYQDHDQYIHCPSQSKLLFCKYKMQTKKEEKNHVVAREEKDHADEEGDEKDHVDEEGEEKDHGDEEGEA